MGVDHAGWTGGTSPPPEFGGGDANTNCPPPDFVIYRYKNERSVAFKIRQNPFSAGTPPRTPLGELTTLPQRKRTHLRRSPCVPPEVQPDLRLCSDCVATSSIGDNGGNFEHQNINVLSDYIRAKKHVSYSPTFM